jgi:hypothetical protein
MALIDIQGAQKVMTDAKTVLHHTDTLRLPWIMAERQLCPTRGMCAADYPRPTFLWATTNAAGDGTAASNHDQARLLWRQGALLLVRFILAADDFTPWADMHRQHPQWTADKVARLERNGRNGRNKASDPARLMCRTDALPTQRWLGIETRSYTGSWRPFDFIAYTALEAPMDDPTKTFRQPTDELCAAAIEIDGRTYVSKRFVPSNGRTMYQASLFRTSKGEMRVDQI